MDFFELILYLLPIILLIFVALLTKRQSKKHLESSNLSNINAQQKSGTIEIYAYATAIKFAD